MTIYTVQEGFYSYAKQHPMMLRNITQLPREQQKQILQDIDEQLLCERAIQYFDCNDIYLKDHVLYYTNTLRSTTHTIRIDASSILVQDHEQNPFLPFLKRIFRSIVSINEKKR